MLSYKVSTQQQAVLSNQNKIQAVWEDMSFSALRPLEVLMQPCVQNRAYTLG